MSITHWVCRFTTHSKRDFFYPAVSVYAPLSEWCVNTTNIHTRVRIGDRGECKREGERERAPAKCSRQSAPFKCLFFT